MQTAAFPILVFAVCLVALALALLGLGNLFSPRRPGRVKQMPYESGMDPIHDTRRRFDVRFHLLAIAFLVFDVELLFLYPWAVAISPANRPAGAASAEGSAGGGGRPAPSAGLAGSGAAGQAPGLPAAPPPGADRTRPMFLGGMVFLAMLTVGYVYDWRKGVFRWR